MCLTTSKSKHVNSRMATLGEKPAITERGETR